jgi:rhodanese-related sulfurtransferase
MNLPTSWQEASSSPLTIALTALIGATLLITFLAPVFFKTIKTTKFPKRYGFIKRYPRRSLAAVIIVLIAIFASYVCYSFSQPVRIVSAVQFKLEKGGQIKELQQKGLSGWQEAGVYLLDIRTRDEYATDHLVGSASSPAEIAAKEKYPIKNVDVVVYSTSPRFAQARRTADAIRKNGESVKRRDRVQFGKIYIIRDGFEGLKKAGLISEEGIWD